MCCYCCIVDILSVVPDLTVEVTPPFRHVDLPFNLSFYSAEEIMQNPSKHNCAAMAANFTLDLHEPFNTFVPNAG